VRRWHQRCCMKLRIEGNAVRLLVTEPELARLKNGAEVAEIIHFGPELQGNLRYSIVIAAQPVPVMVSFVNNAITVSITTEQLNVWVENEQTGVHVKLDVGPTGPLEVAIEKDSAEN
jgi:hypothetical protein